MVSNVFNSIQSPPKIVKKCQYWDSKSINQQIYQKGTQKTSTWGLKKCQPGMLTLFEYPHCPQNSTLESIFGGFWVELEKLRYQSEIRKIYYRTYQMFFGVGWVPLISIWIRRKLNSCLIYFACSLFMIVVHLQMMFYPSQSFLFQLGTCFDHVLIPSFLYFVPYHFRSYFSIIL